MRQRVTGDSRGEGSVRGHDVGDKVVRVLISLTALNGTIKHQYGTMICRLKDEDILKLGFLSVKYFLDFQGLRHALPLIANFAKPSVWKPY